MTTEQALERLHYLLFIYKKDDGDGYRVTGDVFDTDFEALDIALSLIEEYQTEIKSRDERITELEKDVISLNYRIEKLKNQIEEKDKEIKELKGRGLQEQGRN